MRNNQPVTGREVEVKEGHSIVSKTDLKGKIVYCNPTFIEISGFEESELIGAPHNLVRHPDMPVQAFADLWRSIQEGRQWDALVKNRCKNGDHYWVRANVTPIIENAQVVGYMSVRTKPGRAEIAEAELLYQRMHEDDSLQLQYGQLVSTDLIGKLKSKLVLSDSRRLSLCALSAMLITLTWGVLSVQKSGMNLLDGIAMISLLCSISYLWFFVNRGYIQPLQQAIQAARTMAGCDLASSIPQGNKSEMGQLLQAMRQMNINLIAIIADVRTNVNSISVGSREIADGNLNLSNRTESQASSLEETAASMEEFASTIKQNSDSAAQANQLASTASSVAMQGGEMVGQLGITMQEISNSARSIENIIGLIDGIAFQTNILALNAAVEAARAGEQGRGFAVVASEVRSLAQKSASAAKEIKALIEDSMSKVKSGNQLVEKADQTMKHLVQSVQNVSNVISEISTASHEQSDGVEQMNSAVTHMDEITQQNAAMVEQAAAAASNLAEQARSLQQAVSVFKLDKGIPATTLHKPKQTATIKPAPARSTPDKRLRLPGRKLP